MATTVRVDKDTKMELDRLQGLVQSETGDRVTHSELLRRLMSVARRHEAELMAKQGIQWRPPTQDELDHLLEGIEDWGVETDASRVDEALYGGDPHA